jgi:hypothetical protein
MPSVPTTSWAVKEATGASITSTLGWLNAG